MDLKDFSPAQRQALLDLLILAMYADGHLTTAEDNQFKDVLIAMGYAEPSDRHREFNEAVTRVRPFITTVDTAKAHALLLAAAFTTRDQHLQVHAAVKSIMTADNTLSPWETALLAELTSKFNL